MSTTTSQETIEARLAEAEAAYHKIQIGESVRVFVDQNGERIEYKAANLDKLAAYIAQLRRQCNINAQKGPMRITFPC